MKLKDITIGTRLALGFGVILILFSVLGAISYNQSNRLWQNTYDLYNHPLIVGRSVRDVETNILHIHVMMKDIALDEDFSQNQIKSAIGKIDSIEAIIQQQVNVLYERYLGSKSTLDSVNTLIIEWKPLRDELIKIRLSSGRQDAAMRFHEVNKSFVENMLNVLRRVTDFSNDKASTFYTAAEHDRNQLQKRLVILILIILVSSGTILFLLIFSIRNPLKSLSVVTDRYRQGDYNARSDYESRNELGTLASIFNKMAASVQNDIAIKENASWIARLLMEENELKPFCNRLINALLTKTESQIAAIYILNKTTGEFEHFGSIGLSAEKIRSFSAQIGEGEFGAVISQKKILHISDIPDDTVFSFPAVTGNFKPREIVTIPILDDNEVIAVISLATLKNYSDMSIRLLNDIQVILTARLLGVMNYQRIKDFSEVLDLQNRELDQRSKKLLMQSDELKEYNIELEQQKKQLDEANKLKSTFLSNMSHELRTPLNSVIALSGVLNRRLSGKLTEEEYNYIRIIEKNGKSLLSLINDILDLSRIEAGREELTLTRFSIYDLVNDIVISIEPVVEEKGISLSNQVSSDLPLIISDRTKCYHILQNVLSNAVKFTEEGSVEISALVDDGNINISISDTGIGIPEDFMPYVFDEFRQADDKTSRKFRGTGLGLAIVKKYCQLLDGSVEVTSKHGNGSTFTVRLPLNLSGYRVISDEIEHQTESVIRLSGTETKDKIVETRTLLLVEDSEPQIIQLTDILREEGFVIRVARNGREALESINLSIPDAMILDLQMPEVDGFEVLKEIRSIEKTKAIPVLILTAKHLTKSELSFLNGNHIHQLIQKGAVNRNELLAIINKLFSSMVKREPDVKEPVKSQVDKAVNPAILLIEDNPDNVTTVMALLGDKYILSTAIDGNEGLDKAITIRPSLILLDISLPGMDGYRVFDEIKKNENLSGIPVIALTARAMKGDREDLLAYGFNAYISKPIDSDLFKRTINEYLNYEE